MLQRQFIKQQYQFDTDDSFKQICLQKMENLGLFTYMKKVSKISIIDKSIQIHLKAQTT